MDLENAILSNYNLKAIGTPIFNTFNLTWYICEKIQFEHPVVSYCLQF